MAVYICDRCTALGMVDFSWNSCDNYDTCNSVPLCKGKEGERK